MVGWSHYGWISSHQAGDDRDRVAWDWLDAIWMVWLAADLNRLTEYDLDGLLR
jgi:hypothetical protein